MIKINHLAAVHIVIGFCIISFSILGCSATKYRENADTVATELIQQAQLEALGRTEPFSIELPSNRLRKRLLLDQNLQQSPGTATCL
jgi:hypothetical protein